MKRLRQRKAIYTTVTPAMLMQMNKDQLTPTYA